jgi:putative membrane protein insertion efficiency factor
MTMFALMRRASIRLVQAPIFFYRYAISPFIGPVCRHQPTCSAYAIEAIEKRGPVVGLGLTLRRLARCHPVKWLGGSEGYDPVPEKIHSHSSTCETETVR